MKWDKKSAPKLSSIALLSFILASCKGDHDNDLKNWLVSTPITAPYACPTATASGPLGTVPSKPYFTPGPTVRKAAEAGRPVSCLQDGPYDWNGTPWYVQRINFVDENSQKHAAVRVCSLNAAEGSEGPALDLIVKTPGGDVQYVNPTKCQLVSSY